MPVPPATTITGTSGDDSIVGTAGNDVIDGREGNDLIDGGAGSDWVTYQDSPGPVDVFLNPTGFGFGSGGFGDDNLINIENVIGSNFDDVFSTSNSNPTPVDNIFNGLGGNDTMLAGRGNDTLYGGDGQDMLYGQQGDDLIYGEAGNDFMRGGSGNDTLDGGSGFDRVSFFPTGSDTVTSGVTVSLMLQGVAQNTGQGMDTLNGIEALSGTPLNDSLTGDGNINWLVSADFDGAGGDDQLFGLGGNDLLEVAAGNHILDGGSGNDTLSFNALGFALPNGVTASLALQGAAQVTGIGSMTISNVENLSGTALDDVLSGDGNANILTGAGGNDMLSGGVGDDRLYGDAIVSAYDSTGNAVGPQLYTDVVPFDQLPGNDVLDGGKGSDFLYGGRGDDVLTGGLGADQFVIEASSGHDRITDFKHVDTIVFDPSSGAASFSDLVFTAVGKDTLISWGTGDTLLVEGSKPNQLGAADFSFGTPAAAAQAASVVGDGGHGLHAGWFVPDHGIGLG